MQQTFDLHTHTTASDGELTPSQLVKKASQARITLLAITDHDTTAGVQEAIAAGNTHAIQVLSGMELSLDCSFGSMHLCGYCFNINEPALKKNITDLQEARLERNKIIITNLQHQGFDITLADLQKESGKEEIGRPHIAAVLFKKGYVRNKQEAFNKYLAKGAPCYAERKRLEKKEAIGMIVAAGGFAVLAHPGELRLDSAADYRNVIKDLMDCGLSGLEVYSSHHSDAQNHIFKQLADELRLIATGGSDYHMEASPGVMLGNFGSNVTIDTKSLLDSIRDYTGR